MPAAKKKTDLAIVPGITALTPFQATAGRFQSGPTRHHRQYFEDYATAKAHIWQAVGDIEPFEVFGDCVLVAVFCRPTITPGAIIIPETSGEAREDQYQHKAVLILKVGPGAWYGDEDYHKLKFGGLSAPVVGEWVMVNANAGLQMSIMGEGGTRPKIATVQGEQDAYVGDGWPCRLIKDEEVLMRIKAPHGVV